VLGKNRTVVDRVLREVWDPIGVGDTAGARHEYAAYVNDVIALLRTGAGEEAIIEHLLREEAETMGLPPRPAEALIPTARALLKIGVKPRTRGWRSRTMGADVCSACGRAMEFCWGCPCGFRLCQDCLETDRWGYTCNNITWECPDCGGFRSF
jgi:hypothetical protein